ncbi:MAG: mannitol dehydrogenase family protein [Acidimicrobiales bacterium]
MAPATIAHLGVGAFARAHLGVYADDLSRRGLPTLIRGVSMQSRRAQDQLVPQDGLYTVAEREADGEGPLRVIGSITSVAVGPGAAVDAVTAPSTRLVTLTITEKGYDLVTGDLEHPERPTSALGVLTLALARYREAGAAPPVIASLDNVLGNGALLRGQVAQIAVRLDPTLPAWIADEVRFPNSVVDRMVPASTPQDIADISARLGLVDQGAVTTEHHRSWVMVAEEGLPPLGEVGVELVDDIAPFERRKLWLLNGPHSALAYVGILAGCTTIAAATEHLMVAPFVAKLVDDVLEVGRLPAAVQPGAFARDALRRFSNPALGHTCSQVAADGSRKLPQRFASVVTARRSAGLDAMRFAVVVAVWIAAASGLEVQGSALPPVDDPAGTPLRSAAAGRDLRALAHLALADHFDPTFVTDVATSLDRLLRDGMALIRELT